MRQTHFALAVLTAAVLSACGGGSDGTSADEQKLKTTFSNMVSFGDSLSDVGTYAVGTIKAAGGGKFTINGDNTAINPALTGKNWTELIAAQFGLPAPCAAQTGLDGDAAQGFSVPVVNHANCFSYAQGGARVINPVGPEHKLTGSALGLLTVPVVQQVSNHLAKTNGKFSGTEVVFVTAGGIDALALLGELQAGATAAGQAAGAAEGAKVGAQVYLSTLIALLADGATDKQAAAQAIGLAAQTEAQRTGSTQETITQVAIGTAAAQPGNAAVGQVEVYGPIVVKARFTAEAAGKTAGEAAGAKAGADYAAAQAPALVTAMGTAGAQLAGIVKEMIVANGANYVVVNNLPDLGGSPAGKAQDAATQTLINTMVATFNDQLRKGLGTDSKILYVDLYTTSHDQINNPAPYGLTNTTSAACTVDSLICTGKTLVAGDVSRYMFADNVLPTPFENALIAKYVAQQMIIKGWL
ncbi:esterase [Massilia sp. PAMC28688]|uniref:SGNH/GDSL hydrolase family protein n=1 Tax=Massilia sp. PAMC28688 TaxID=2861283 RepID=UPI001C632AEE|nr:SGNH/GDSL hydrolase family protein [Massilia sp. PAMC28688]QYF95692.1 esterase [Massilia sp. PAMC28688]